MSDIIVSPSNPLDVVWGIYKRKGKIFRLVAACLKRESALSHAAALKNQTPGDYAVQGQQAAISMPDTLIVPRTI